MRIRRRAVRDEIGDGRAAAGEILRDRVVQVIGPDDEDALIDERSARRHRVADAFGAELRHHDVRLDAAGDRADPRSTGPTAQTPTPPNARRSRGPRASAARKRATAVADSKTTQSIAVERRRRAIDGFRILRRRQAERRRLDRFRAEVFQRVDQLARLIGRSRHDDAPAEERALVEPAQVLAQAGDLADDEERRLVAGRRWRRDRPARASVPVIVRCAGCVPR